MRLGSAPARGAHRIPRMDWGRSPSSRQVRGPTRGQGRTHGDQRTWWRGLRIAERRKTFTLRLLVQVTVNRGLIDRRSALPFIRRPDGLRAGDSSGGNSQQPNKGAPHHVDVSESGGRGHLFEACLRAFELTTRCLHARVKHILRWCRAHLASKNALEVPHTHRHPIGKTLFVWRCSAIQICSSRIDIISEACEASETLSCGCPPGRRRNNTSSRAASCARLAPQSSSTHAKARSMPAEMPAEV